MGAQGRRRRHDQGRPLRQGRDAARVPLHAARHLRLGPRRPEDGACGYSTNEQIAQALSAVSRAYAESNEWQPGYDTDDLLDLIDRLSLAEDVPYVALPSVPETLGYLRRKGYRLGVATVDTRSATVAGLKKTGILEYFDYLGTGEEAQPKPDPCLADTFCRECGLLPGELLIVGDGENDMLFARNAGAHFVGIDAADGASSVFRGRSSSSTPCRPGARSSVQYW